MTTAEQLTRRIDVGLAALAEARATDGTISPARVIEIAEQMGFSYEDAVDITMACVHDRLFELVLRRDDGAIVDGDAAKELLSAVACGTATREQAEMEVLYRPL